MPIAVRELDAEEIKTIYPLIRQLNPQMEESVFHERLSQMLQRGYRCAGAFNQENILMGISGFWVLCRFWCGEHIDIDNVIIDEKWRGSGVGKALMKWIEEWAVQRGFGFAVLDAFAHNIPAHKFYYQQGYVIRGFHFTKELPKT